jgi:fumarylacetoacetase
MSDTLDRSHDPARRSWEPSGVRHPDFPIQNLPFAGTPGGVVVAIGEMALPIAAALEAGWGRGLGLDPAEFATPFLNRYLLTTGPAEWRALRLALSDALADPAERDRLAPLLVPHAALELLPAVTTRDYSDFYASIHHATNVGSMFRPDNPLLPNYKWIPIGYHGRASTLVPDGTPIRRPSGQTRAGDAAVPTVGPSQALDYELELGLVLGGQNAVGVPVPADRALERIFGVVLLNDWSARDIQSWEYQPLGPFLAKSFATTVGPWLVTRDALRPYQVAMPARPAGDPDPLPYLSVPDDHTWSIELEVRLRSAAMRARDEAAARLSRVNFRDAMYWSPGQLVTHHASGGCALAAGDLLGTGTISGPDPEARGCLLELTWRGRDPIALPDGSARRFLDDGDELALVGHATAPGHPPLGFGPCRGVITAA